LLAVSIKTRHPYLQRYIILSKQNYAKRLKGFFNVMKQIRRLYFVTNLIVILPERPRYFISHSERDPPGL